VSGSLVIGFVDALVAPGGPTVVNAPARQFVMAGLCGGYTTFSAFSLQTLDLAREGEWLRAGGNVAASVAACLAAVWLGRVAAIALSLCMGG
jgi:fluoride exporter